MLIDKEYLSSFIEKQKQLSASFVAKFSVTGNLDETLVLLELPVRGEIRCGHRDWRFFRHGAGVKFVAEDSGEVIDMHVKLGSGTELIDSWRIKQHLESTKNQQFDEADVGDLLDGLCSSGLLVRNGSLYQIDL